MLPMLLIFIRLYSTNRCLFCYMLSCEEMRQYYLMSCSNMMKTPQDYIDKRMHPAFGIHIQNCLMISKMYQKYCLQDNEAKQKNVKI